MGEPFFHVEGLTFCWVKLPGSIFRNIQPRNKAIHRISSVVFKPPLTTGKPHLQQIPTLSIQPVEVTLAEALEWLVLLLSTPRNSPIYFK